MPILEKEISVYPSHLLTEQESEQDPDSNWYVVYTRARHEKSLARQLHSNSMSFYLPLIPKEQFIRGRKVYSHLPVFSSYLFYFGPEPDRIGKAAPYCVSAVLPVNNQKMLQTELAKIYNLIQSGIPFTIESQLSPGQKVRVKSGTLRGLEGVIIRRKNCNRLLVAVNYLQQGVSVEIDDFMLERI